MTTLSEQAREDSLTLPPNMRPPKTWIDTWMKHARNQAIEECAEVARYIEAGISDEKELISKEFLKLKK
jgi:hypothetical protein